MSKHVLWAAAFPALVALALLIGCDEPKPPPRNQMKPIKQTVYDLQEAVKRHDPAALDALLSARILDNNLSSDSLLSFCYGPGSTFAFARFGDCGIAYTASDAVVECFVVDTGGDTLLPIRLNFTREKIKDSSVWLLTSFSEWSVVPDSAAASAP